MANDLGFTPTGLNVKGIDEIIADINATLTAAFGDSLNLEDQEVIGQLRNIFAEKWDLSWQALTAFVDNIDEDKAEGVFLDLVGAFAGLKRLQATKSKVLQVALFGTATTVVPSGTLFSVDGNPDAVFETLADVTLITGSSEAQRFTLSSVPTSGSFELNFLGETTALINWDDDNATLESKIEALNNISSVNIGNGISSGLFFVTFLAENAKIDLPLMTVTNNTLSDGGAVSIVVTEETKGVSQGNVDTQALEFSTVKPASETLTVIDTPIAGLTSILNRAAGISGRLLEDDTDFRIRIKASKQISRAGTVDGIRQALLDLNLDTTKVRFTSVVVQENVTDVIDSKGLNPHSIRAIVREEGDTTTRDQEVRDTLLLSGGGGIEMMGDISGTSVDSNGFTQTVKFERVTLVDIYIEIDLTRGSDYPTDGDTKVTDAIVEHGNAIGAGNDIIVHPTLDAVIGTIQGVLDVEIRIGTSASPTLDDNIAIDDGSVSTVEASNWASGRVTIGTI